MRPTTRFDGPSTSVLAEGGARSILKWPLQFLAIIGGVLAIGLVATVLLPYTPYWQQHISSPNAADIAALRQMVLQQQQQISALQNQISNLIPSPPIPPAPSPFGVATALNSLGVVLPIGNLQPGSLLIREQNSIVSIVPDGNFIDSALGYIPENRAFRGVPNGYAALDSMGLVPTFEIPPAAFTHFYYVNLTSSLVLLTTANVGDYAVVFNTTSNLTTNYVLQALPPSVLGNWLLVNQPNSGIPAGNVFVNNGNAFGSTAVLGTTDSNSLFIITNNTVSIIVDPAQNTTTINSNTTFVKSLSALGTITSQTLSSGVVISSSAGQLQNANLGAGLSFSNSTLINSGVVSLTSNSSNIIVANDGAGIWSLLLNFNGTLPTNSSIAAGQGISVLSPTPDSFIIANTGVLSVQSPDGSLQVNSYPNGTVLLAVVPVQTVSSLISGAGIFTNATSGAIFINSTAVLGITSPKSSLIASPSANGNYTLDVNTNYVFSLIQGGPGINASLDQGNLTISNTGILSLFSGDNSIIFARYPNGSVNLQINQTSEASFLTAGIGIGLSANVGNVTISNLGLLNANATGPGISLVVENGTAVITSSALTQVLASGGFISTSNYPNGTAIVTAPVPVISISVTGPGLIQNSTFGNVLLTSSCLTEVFATGNFLKASNYPNGTAVISSVTPVISLFSNSLEVVNFGNGNWSIDIANGSVVNYIQPGNGIGVSANFGNVTISNLGLISANVTGPGLSLAINSGTALFTSSALVDVFSTGGFLTSQNFANGSAVISSVLPVVSLSVSGPGLQLNASQGDLLLRSSCLTQIFATGGFLESANFPNGSSVISSPMPIISLSSQSLQVVDLGQGNWTIDIINGTEVSLIEPGVGIGVSANFGNVTITNLGILGINSTGPGLDVKIANGVAELTSSAITNIFTSGGFLSSVNFGNGNISIESVYPVTSLSVSGPGVFLNASVGDLEIVSTCLTDVFTTGGFLEFANFPNGSAIISSPQPVISIASSSLSVVNFGNGNWSIDIVNGTEVLLVEAGVGIGVSANFGNVTISNLGLLSANVTGPGLTVAISSGIAQFTSSALTDIFAEGGFLSATNYANGTTLISSPFPVTSISTFGPGISANASNGDLLITSTCVTQVISFGGFISAANYPNGTTEISSELPVVSINSASLNVTDFGNGNWSIDILSGTEVSLIEPGYGIGVSANFGNVTISNLGIVSVNATGTGLNISVVGGNALFTSTALTEIFSFGGFITASNFPNGSVALGSVYPVTSLSVSGPGLSLNASVGDLEIVSTCLTNVFATGGFLQSANFPNGSAIITSSLPVISISSSSLSVLDFGNGSWVIDIINGTEVSLIEPGIGIGVSANYGNVTISNLGLLTANSTGPGLSVAVVAGTAIFTSSAVTEVFSTGGFLQSANYANGTSIITSQLPVINLSSGSLNVTNLGAGNWTVDIIEGTEVSLIEPGIGIGVSANFGNVTIFNTGVLNVTVSGPGISSLTNSGVVAITSTALTQVYSTGGFISAANFANGSAVISSPIPVVTLSSVGPGILVNSSFGNVQITSSALTTVFTTGGFLSSANYANGTAIISTSVPVTSLSVTGPGLSLNATSSDLLLTSTCLTQVFGTGGFISSAVFSNGTAVVSSVVPVLSVGRVAPITNSGTATNPIIGLQASGVTAASYTYASITVDVHGLITAASNGITPVTLLTVAGPGLSLNGTTGDLQIVSTCLTEVFTTGGFLSSAVFANGTVVITSTSPVSSVTVTAPITNTGSSTAAVIGLANSGVSAGTYSYATVTVDVHGLVSSASNGAIPVTLLSVSGPGLSLNGTTGDLQITSTCLTQVFATGGFISSTVFANGTAVISSSIPVLSVGVTSPITNTGTSTAPVLALAASGASPGVYTYPTVTVNSFGLVTSIANATQPVTSIVSGTLTVQNLGNGVWNISDIEGAVTDWLLTGNTLSANATIGTLNNYDFVQIANGLESFRISAANQYVGVATSVPQTHLDVNGSFRARNIAVTQSSYSTGTVSMSGSTTVTGSGTTFTSSMVGGLLVFSSSDAAVLIVGYTSATVLTAAIPATVSSTSFNLYYGGTSIQYAGWLATTNAFLAGTVYDGVFSAGSSGQILTSTGSGVRWQTGSGGGGVSAIYNGAGISVNSNTGSVTVTNTGVVTLNAGTAIAISGGSGTFTVANNGVTQLNAGGGISISSSTGSVTIANNGVVSIASGVAMSVTSAGTTWTVNNNGVTSAAQGTGIQISSATGAVTFTNLGVVSLAPGTGITITYVAGGTSTITNAGVTSLSSGGGISVTSATGSSQIINTGVISIQSTTLTVTNLGSGTWKIEDPSIAKQFYGQTSSLSGGSNNAAWSINHGLGVTPTYCSATSISGSHSTPQQANWANVDAVTSTSVSGHVLVPVAVGALGGYGIGYDTDASYVVMVYCHT